MLIDGGVYVNNPAVLGYLLGDQTAGAGRPLVLVHVRGRPGRLAARVSTDDRVGIDGPAALFA